MKFRYETSDGMYEDFEMDHREIEAYHQSIKKTCKNITTVSQEISTNNPRNCISIAPSCRCRS